MFLTLLFTVWTTTGQLVLVLNNTIGLVILPTARPNDISWYRCTALEAQSPPYFNTRGIAHNCHTTATTIYRLSGTQPALLRPGAVPVFCQSVRAAVQRPGWELLDQSPWQLSHWSHLTVDIYLLFFFFFAALDKYFFANTPEVAEQGLWCARVQPSLAAGNPLPEARHRKTLPRGTSTIFLLHPGLL